VKNSSGVGSPRPNGERGWGVRGSLRCDRVPAFRHPAGFFDRDGEIAAACDAPCKMSKLQVTLSWGEGGPKLKS
jgi:hypothetical protein